MTAIVIDASVIGPLLFIDEVDDLHPALRRILRAGDAVVPQHWRLEVASMAQIGIRRGRLTEDEATLNLDVLSQSAITVDGDTGSRARNETRSLATRHRLTVYDAAYLELALRRRLPLASTDTDLCDAARAEGVEVLPP